MFSKAQNINKLNKLGKNDSIPPGETVIYGNFIQRLGFSSGGFPQDIRIMNTQTKELFSFRVKPTFKSAKENAFCYILKPGTYAIYYYCWTQSKWYGAKLFTEPIYKNIDATDKLAERIKLGQIKEKDLLTFTFTLAENSINYLGTWHFDKGLVSFSDDKQILELKVAGKYKKIDFAGAKINLPN